MISLTFNTTVDIEVELGFDDNNKVFIDYDKNEVEEKIKEQIFEAIEKLESNITKK